jgi:peptidoglycan/LPS O-acetylase OafA/YrhL
VIAELGGIVTGAIGEHHIVSPNPGAAEAGPEITLGPESPTPKRPPRFPSFDGLRAIAAITVVGVHSAFVSGLTPKHRHGIGIYTSRLEIGVAVFFLISGFLLYRPFTVAHFAKAPRPGTRSFWIRRILRIVPAYWVALFFATTVLSAGPGIGPGGWKAYVTHYLFLQIYFQGQNLTGISAAWSLCVEMSFYFFIPLYAWWIGSKRDSLSTNQMLAAELGGVALLIAISFIYRIILLQVIGQHAIYARLAVIWLPGELDLFGLGMGLAIISAWFHHEGFEPKIFSSRAFPWVSWALAAACFVAVSNIGLPVLPVYIPSTIEILRQTLYGGFAFFLLLPAVFGPQHQGLIRRALQLWPVAALGVISYGIYLWHEIWIYKILHWDGDHLFDMNFSWFFLGVMALTIISSSISYFALEKPILRLKRLFSWFDTLKSRPQP